MIVLITDSHFGTKGFSKSLFEMQMNYFEKELFPFLLKNQIKYVIHLGDLVHNRNIMDLYILSEFKRKFLSFFDNNKINLYCMIGNHDIYFKNTLDYNFHETAGLNNYKYINIIKSPTIIQFGQYKFGLIPWMISEDQKIPSPADVHVLCGHLEIRDALMWGTIYSKRGVEFSKFDGYKLVLTGHFHAQSKIGNVQYLGTQYQLNWMDYNNIKGFWTLDEYTLEMKFHENLTSPKHLKIYYFEEDSGVIWKIGGLKKDPIDATFEQVQQYTSGNNIKLIIKKMLNNDLFMKYFETLNKNSQEKIDVLNESSVIEDFNFSKYEVDIKENDDIDLLSLMKGFIENSSFTKDVDKKELLNSIEILYEDARTRLFEEGQEE